MTGEYAATEPFFLPLPTKKRTLRIRRAEQYDLAYQEQWYEGTAQQAGAPHLY